MRSILYGSLLLLLISIGTPALSQEEPPENNPGPCICYPEPAPISLYTCSNIPAGDHCSSHNLGFEDPHYFKFWRANYGVVCKKSLRPTTAYNIESPNAPSHTPFFNIIDNSSAAYDPYCGFPTRHSMGEGRAVMIGDHFPLAHAASLITTVKVNRNDPNITFLFAFVLSNICGDSTQEPFFSLKVYNTAGCTKVIDLNYALSRAGQIPGLKYSQDGALGYKEWTSYSVNMYNFFTNPLANDEYFTIEYTVADCGYCVHLGYAYVDAVCGSRSVVTKPVTDPDPLDPDPVDPEDPFIGVVKCTGADVIFNGAGDISANETFYWDFGDGAGWSTEENPVYHYSKPGLYTVIKKITNTENSKFNAADTLMVKVIDCCSLENIEKIQKENCITDFSPVEGETYILQAWVREDAPGTDSRIHTYERVSPHIEVKLSNGVNDVITVSCFPSGPVIDGWQRVEQEFTIPSCPDERVDFALILHGLTSGDEGTYFDDIRVFPKKGGMKSYVYDPASQKLLSELDEENFATFYEYDQEGALIRVKKETERGIKTIKEAGNNTSNTPPEE